MNSVECCEFNNKNRPITSEDIIHGSRTCSDCLLLLQDLISGGALKYEFYYSSSCTIVLRRSTSSMYVQSFVFAGQIEWRLSENTEVLIRTSVVSSIRNPTNRIGGYHTWSYMLGLSTTAKSDLGRRIKMRVLLQQQQYSCSGVLSFEYVQTKSNIKTRPMSVSDVSRSFQS